ncbi:hypothetical protein [Chachezhania sediminis]|uniref:hypothetical protein n=1 Tax=Chachezhania sediminis TaxID=2599291 RepID=UPI00131AF75C|nr:hypothetical protein [Chachezhania sediminis]
MAFMGLVASWEEFLERSLVRYLAGATTDSGYQPALKHGQADSIEHAYKVLSLDPSYQSANSYLKVSDPAWVRSRADFFFKRHSFGGLQNSADLLKHASKIRNRVAHESSKCKSDFKSTAIFFLQPANNQLSQGYSSGDLLLSPVFRHFGQNVVQLQLNHFQAYAERYSVLANQIVP